MPGAMTLRRTSPTGPMAGRAFRPCGFPPAPAPRGPTSRLDGRRLAAPHLAGTGSTRVMHRRVSHRQVFRYPSRAIARLGRGPCCRAPATLLGFDPSRCCSRPRVSGRLRPSDPPAVFLDAPSRSRRMLRTAPAGRRPLTHFRPEGTGGRGLEPRLLGFVPAGGRFPRSCATAKWAHGACPYRLGLFLSQVFGRRRWEPLGIPCRSWGLRTCQT